MMISPNSHIVISNDILCIVEKREPLGLSFSITWDESYALFIVNVA